MFDLKSAMRSVLKQQQSLAEELRRVSINLGNVIDNNVYETWLSKCGHIQSLEKIVPLSDIRDVAYQNLLNLKRSFDCYPNEPIGNMVPFGGTNISASIATTLAMNAYLSACWALFDCLSNIIGRVVGDESIRNNPQGRSNPKLIETFLAVKQGIDVLGSREILLKSYGQRIGFSYLLRNCYVHEGGMINGFPLLQGETMEAAFVITKEVAEKINDEIFSRYKIPNTTIVKDGDVIGQLYECHSQLDQMFVSLLRFMMGTLVIEVEAFAAQDGFKVFSGDSVNTGVNIP